MMVDYELFSNGNKINNEDEWQLKVHKLIRSCVLHWDAPFKYPLSENKNKEFLAKD